MNTKHMQEDYLKAFMYLLSPQTIQDLQILRTAFGLTIKSISQRNQLLETESEKLKQIIKEYERMIYTAQNKINSIEKQFQQYKHHIAMREKELRQKKLQLDKLEYKCKQMSQNRQTVAYKLFQGDSPNDSRDCLERQIYQEVAQFIKIKLSRFLSDIQNDQLTLSTKNKVEQFALQLMYIHPKSRYFLKQRQKHRKNMIEKQFIGRIVDANSKRDFNSQRILNSQDAQINRLLTIKKQIQYEQGLKRINKAKNITFAKPQQSTARKTRYSGTPFESKRKPSIKNNSMYGNLRSSFDQESQ